MLTSATNIAAPAAQVWDILLDKFKQPERYIPQVLEVEIKQRADNEYIRSLYTEMDDVVELVTIDEANWCVTYTLVRHAFLKGTLINRIEVVDENACHLVFEQDREITLAHLQGIDMQPALDAAVEQIKVMAEEAV